MKIRMLPALLALLTLVACGGSGPASVVEDFYARVEAGELDAAIELFSDSLRSQIGAEKLK